MSTRATFKASQVISVLQQLMDESDSDPEVLGQSHGCCMHGHDIMKIEWDDEFEKFDVIVIRV